MPFIMVLCLLILSCQSARVEYRYIVPDIEYPIFPALEREINKDGSWTIPKESADLLAEYYIRVQEAEKDYKEIKESYEKENRK